MNRFWSSFFYGLIVTVAIMGPAYGFGVFYTIATGGDAVAYFVDCVKLAFVLLIFSTWGLYELNGAFARMNRRRDDDGNNGTGPNGGTGPGKSDSPSKPGKGDKPESGTK